MRTALLLLFCAPFAGAQDGLNLDVLEKDLLDCQNSESLRTHCRLHETTLAPSQCVGEGETQRCFEVAFRVQYDFACNGHPVAVGVNSERKSAKFKFGSAQSLRLVGVGPFSTVNIDPEQTKKATLSKECALKVTGLQKQLSPGSIDRVQDYLSQLQTFNGLLARAKSIESLSAALRGILLQIDLPTLATLLDTLGDRITALKEAYPEVEAKEALGLLQKSLAEASEDLEGGASEQDLLAVSAHLDELGTLSAKISEAIATNVAERFVYGMEMVAFGSDQDKKQFVPLFKAEDQKARTLMGEPQEENDNA